MRDFYVYILADRRNGRTYTGFTNDLLRRVSEHKSHTVEGHTKRYGIHRLVYFEHTGDAYSAIAREKQIKAMSRAEKLALIESANPRWSDLYDGLS